MSPRGGGWDERPCSSNGGARSPQDRASTAARCCFRGLRSADFSERGIGSGTDVYEPVSADGPGDSNDPPRDVCRRGCRDSDGDRLRGLVAGGRLAVRALPRSERRLDGGCAGRLNLGRARTGVRARRATGRPDVAKEGADAHVAALIARRAELERLVRTALLPALDSFVLGSARPAAQRARACPARPVVLADDRLAYRVAGVAGDGR